MTAPTDWQSIHQKLILTGLTFSSDFPLKNPAQTYPGNGYQNAFIAKFRARHTPVSSFLLLLPAD